MEVAYSADAQEHIQYWKKTSDKKVLNRISSLIASIEQTPFSGIGKPEPLKNDLRGYWSRRINKEHRLIYRVTGDNKIVIISLRFHY